MKTPTLELQGVSQTLLAALACRAIETSRPDALLCDPRAAELVDEFEGGKDWLQWMSPLDQTFTVMRVRQFDRYTRRFLAAHPEGLVVDIGCGLDTRFNRLDNGRMSWLGLDLQEVITLRRQFLPDAERCRSLACSMFDLTWLDEAGHLGKPAIFLAEGVFPYFTQDQVKPVITALAGRFIGGELVFDALSSMSVWMHNRTHPVLQESGVRLRWGLDDPRSLEAWGLRLMERWGYFDQREPRLGLAYLMRHIPGLAYSNYVLHYQLGN